jgi:hypothetical protein
MVKSARYAANAIGIAFVTIAVVYGGFVAYAFITGKFLPAGYVFRKLAPATWLNEAVVRLPVSLLIASAVGSALWWLAAAFKQQASTQTFEVSFASAVRWTGPLLMIALLTIILGSGGYSGFITSADVQYMAFGSLVPYSDSLGYALSTFYLAGDGRWDWVSGTRPFAAAFRNLFMLVGGYSYLANIVVQMIALSLALYFATRSVSRWRGLWSGAAFLALSLVFSRSYIASTMTETLGLIWAFVSIGFFAEALRARSFPCAVATIGFTMLAQQTRMGAVFIVPALMAWTIYELSPKGRRWRDFIIVCAAVAIPVLVGSFLVRVFGALNTAEGWNLAYIACALATDSEWYECGARIPPNLPTPAARADFMYALAWEGLRTDPTKLFSKLYKNGSSFLWVLPHNMIVAHDPPIVLQPGTARNLLALLIPGMAYFVFRKGRAADTVLFVALFVLIFLSALLIFHHDGWRSLYATHPLMALIFAIGFANPAATESTTPSPSASAMLTFSGIVAGALIVAPFVVRHLGEPPAQIAAPGQRFVYGGRMVTGFIIVPDGTPPMKQTPSLPASTFASIMTRVPMETEWGPFIADITSRAPIAFFWTPDLRISTRSGGLYFGPPEIVTNRKAKAWRLTIGNPAWKKPRSAIDFVERAEPLP